MPPQGAFLAEEALRNQVGRMTRPVNVSQQLSVVPVVPVQQAQAHECASFVQRWRLCMSLEARVPSHQN